MLSWLLVTLSLLGLFLGIVAPPVLQEKTTKPPTTDAPLGLEYEHYLKEVISHLEGDADFRKQLEAANASEIQDGSIARHLKFVSHNVRSKLDEVKRREIERLRDLASAQQQMHQAQGNKDFKPFQMPLHLDLKDHKFSEEDLQKLIMQTTKDLEKADKDRQKEFKNYEMEKEHLRREKLKHAKDKAERKALEKDFEEMKKKHNDHEKFNHPGSKKQLEEVWEEDDKMDRVDFNPKTFFKLHDVNSDNFLDQAEVEALFQKELNKAYDADKSEDDLMERYEEMNRMREHVFKEFDMDKDGLISYEEFIEATKKTDFEKPQEEYKPLEEEDVFTDDEFKQFEDEYDEDEEEEDTSDEEVVTPVQHMQERNPGVDAQMQKPVQESANKQHLEQVQQQQANQLTDQVEVQQKLANQQQQAQQQHDQPPQA